MVNIYILTSDKSIYNKLKEGLEKTSYMDIESYLLDRIDDIIDLYEISEDDGSIFLNL